MERYTITEDGRIISNVTGKVLKSHTCKKGYHRVNLKGQGTQLVHRLVASAFVENPDPNIFVQVNHKDGNKNNNKASNLEWVTNFMNVRHSVATGLIPLGDERPNAKFSNEDVRMVRAIKEDWPDMTYYQIAQLFGCSYQTIHKIITRQTYKHVV